MTLSITPLQSPQEIALLAKGLEAEGLPTADLYEPGRRFFQLAKDKHPIGYVGLEIYGEVALLRSLLVAPQARGRGHGRAVVEWVTDFAKDQGVNRMAVLTTREELADFFCALGFFHASRDKAPEAIVKTEQFSALCPDSAYYLESNL